MSGDSNLRLQVLYLLQLHPLLLLRGSNIILVRYLRDVGVEECHLKVGWN